jgi:FkbM family methyltransferase
LFSRLCGTSGRVYAFEPWPENCSALSANLKINSITNVEVVPAAVSERSGSQTFHRGSDDSQGSLLPRAEDPFPGECIQVPTLSLDEFVELPQARPPELLKLDIEGGEAVALRGARRVLVDHKPVVLCEIHGQTFGEEVRSILSETSFRLFILEAGFRALTPREILPPWCHILACAEQSFSEIAAAMGNQ